MKQLSCNIAIFVAKMDSQLIRDLEVILGHVHVFAEHGQIVNTVDDITILGRELLGDCFRISFKDLQSADLIFNDGEPCWSFVGILQNDTIGWLRAEYVDDPRIYKLRLVVSHTYPAWWPNSETLS